MSVVIDLNDGTTDEKREGENQMVKILPVENDKNKNDIKLVTKQNQE